MKGPWNRGEASFIVKGTYDLAAAIALAVAVAESSESSDPSDWPTQV